MTLKHPLRDVQLEPPAGYCEHCGAEIYEYDPWPLCQECQKDEEEQDVEEDERTTGELIEVVQLPVIVQQLYQLKERFERYALDAEEMVCAPETIQTAKNFRADMHKEFDVVDLRRKQVREEVTRPLREFDAIFEECVSAPFRKADETCKQKIYEVESDIKRRCEDGLRDYFAELCAVRHIDWLEFERTGIKIDLTSAKTKTPAKLRKQLAEFVAKVGDSIDRILEMENAEEIMVEFKRSLNAVEAIGTVQERHRRIEQERAEREAQTAIKAQEAEAVRRVEALAPPVQVQAVSEEKTVKCTFTVTTTISKLKKLKIFLNEEEINYVAR